MSRFVRFNRVMLAITTVLALTVVFGEASPAQATDEYLECSPCSTETSGLITHEWELACCMMDSPGCFMYPDAQRYGNVGTCPGMHRPCTTT